MLGVVDLANSTRISETTILGWLEPVGPFEQQRCERIRWQPSTAPEVGLKDIAIGKGVPDHIVVVKYVPAVGDSKRAIDGNH
ncbi:Myo-inositol-1-phosphate synthase [Marasmius sp. AFHP31]|nr:Myo-inositol-1-phosphate synthase [Marasmius sp. AFHP31]